MIIADELQKTLASRNLVFFGTGKFAVPTLEKLCTLGIRPAAVVTTPDAVAGRERKPAPPPVKVAAERLGLRVMQPQKLDEAFGQELKSLKPRVALLTDYGKIVPERILNIPDLGFLNIHPSLLPKYRGASPVEGAILAGDVETGVSIMRMDALVDHGPVLVRRKVKIQKHETSETLRSRLAKIGSELMGTALLRYLNGKAKLTAQPEEEATFTRQLSREDAKLAFAEDAEALERKVRAYTPWPGAYAMWRTESGEKRVKIIDAMYGTSPEGSDEKPEGTVVASPEGIGILTSNGTLYLRMIQLEGKNPMVPKDFLNGYPNFVGSVLV